MRRDIPAVACLLLLPGLASPAAGQGERLGTTGRGEILVTGRVVEREDGAAVAGARVVLVGTGQEQATDRQGLFAFLRIPPGRYWLHVEHIGYAAADDTVTVPGRGRLELDIQLSTRPMELEPVVASVERAGGPGIRGFYERRLTGIGRYLTRADMERPGVVAVSDALRVLPELRLAARVASGFTVGHGVRFNDGCDAAVYVDGVRLNEEGPTIDEILVPGDVEGIEIYRGAQTPLEFSGRGACGAVAIWTRSGGGGEGRLPFWRGLLYAGAFVAAAALMVIGL